MGVWVETGGEDREEMIKRSDEVRGKRELEMRYWRERVRREAWGRARPQALWLSPHREP